MGTGVFFLDFDGPFYPRKIFILPENKDEQSKEMCSKLNLYPKIGYWKMDPYAVAMMNNIYNHYYPFDAVISSSWSHPQLHDKEQIQGLMDINGFQCPMHEDWRTDKSPYKRVEQIALWLKNHPEVDKYMIFDDNESGSEMLEKSVLEVFGLDPDCVVMVDMMEGLTMEHYYHITKIVSTWS